jgi:YD repeat-containing protein
LQVSQPLVVHTYDRWGNVLSVSDPRSPTWVTRYTYNANNELTSQTQPDENGTGSV